MRLEEEEDKTLCAICYCNFAIDPDDPGNSHMVLMTNCAHPVHIACAREKFNADIDSRYFPIKCAVPECGVDAKPRDIHSVIAPEYREKYERYKTKMFFEQNPDFA